MNPKESEKMRIELESFLNTGLKRKEHAWPVKHLDLLNLEVHTQEEAGVSARSVSENPSSA